MHDRAKPPKQTGSIILDLRGKTPNSLKPQVEPVNSVTTEQIQKATSNNPPKKIRKTRRWRRILAVLLSIIMIGVGLYILFILLYPKINKPSETVVRQNAEAVVQNKNQVFIPSAGIQSEIKEGGLEILDQGVVQHRLPERGNPEKGGNFILTGHSFVWGYTPQEVTKQSVFYHLVEVNIGDEIIVHWNGKKYIYTVKEKTTVKPDAIEVEKTSNKPVLTIYTCTTGGASDGRVVIIAEPLS